MMTAGKRALITGIHGFTGRYMAAELQAGGYEVFGLGAHGVTEAHYFQADLGDATRLKQVLAAVKPSVVVHLAALAFVGLEDAQAFHRVNVLGTRNLLAAIEQCGRVPDCVLVASSANVYGNASPGLLNEQTPPAPANDYAASKLAMEHMVESWHDRLPIVVTRPFNYTGVGQGPRFLLPKIVAHFQQKAPRIELGNLEVWRDFSDVRAVVRAYLGLLEARPLGLTVNVGSGRAHSLREILQMCQVMTGHAMEVVIDPALVRANEVKMLCSDSRRLQALVPGWQTPPLESTLEWMLTAQ